MEKMLEKLFGTENETEIIAKKSGKGERAIPAMVSRVEMDKNEAKYLCGRIGLTYQEGYESRVFRFTMTDETVDRYGDIIRAKGGDLAHYKKNPVVLAFHNSRALPVGISLKTFYDEADNDIKAWVLFYGDSVDTTGLSETVYRYVMNGAMKTGSIGFIPKDGGVLQPDEKTRKELKMPSYGVIYDAWELLEFSITPVPANPSATMRDTDAIKRGVYTKENVEAAKADGSFDADLLAAIEQLAADEIVDPEANDGKSVTPPQTETINDNKSIEYVVKFQDEIAEKLTTLANKITLLIDKLDIIATGTERGAESHVSDHPNGGEPQDGENEVQELYAGLLDTLASDTKRSIEKLGKGAK